MRYENNRPLISVIVPIYNGEDYVLKCIESITNQTYKNLEIILVDDGSTDASGDICDECMRKDSRIKVIHKVNEGLVSSRKAGIQIAKGYYATYVDGDDWIEPDMYEKLVDQILDADIIVSGVIRDYGNHLIRETNKIPDGIYEGNDLKTKIYSKMIYTGTFFERGIQPNIYKALYKREILLKNQIQLVNDIRLGEDAACFYPTILDANKVVLTSDCFYHYQIHKGSIMDTNYGDDLWRLKIVYHYLRKRFSEKEDLKVNLIEQLDYMMIFYLLLKEVKALQGKEGIFPYSGIKEGDKLVVYGAGRFGQELMNFIKGQDKYSVIAWVDGIGRVGNIEDYNSTDYDYILVAVLMLEIAEEITNELIDKGIPENKIKKLDLKEIEAIKEKLEKIME